jgi:hypothetical protein
VPNVVPIQKLFLLSTASHAQGQSYLLTLGKDLEGFKGYVGEGLAPKAMAADFKRKPG